MLTCLVTIKHYDETEKKSFANHYIASGRTYGEIINRVIKSWYQYEQDSIFEVSAEEIDNENGVVMLSEMGYLCLQGKEEEAKNVQLI